MHFSFYSPRALEPWDYRNPDEKGIGNSETSHIEMALRLAKRGHIVTSYTELPKDCPDTNYGGVEWRPLNDRALPDDGIWVLYRCPDVLDQISVKTAKQVKLWLVVQDTYFKLTDAQAKKLSKVLVLCDAQRKAQALVSPNVEKKLVLTSNGIRVDMIEEIERQQSGYRNIHRLHFSSSPDRGLPTLLEKIFPRAKEFVPDLELHIYYGLNNIEALMAMGDDDAKARAKAFFGPSVEKLMRLREQPGVFWHGRVGQRTLTREWLKAGLFVFPSLYPESSCASVMEAQALGAIPIAQNRWAVGENTKFGTLLDGDSYGDPLTQARYTAETVRLAASGGRYVNYRQLMMEDARKRFSWDNWAVQWEALAEGKLMTRDEAVVAREAERHAVEYA